MSVTIGIIGTSHIASEFVRAATQVRGVRLGAICSRHKETAESFLKKMSPIMPGDWVKNEIRIFTSPEALADADGIDAVYVASPNFLHPKQTIRMLRGGKHVLCEKPFAPCLADAKEMFRAAEEEQLFLMEAMRPVHDPGMQMLKDNLSKLGRIRGCS